MKTKFTSIDLFCGAGGLSLGFEQAGFRLLYANDFDRHSIETFKMNRPEISGGRIVCDDINNFLKSRGEELAKSSCDIVIGGPPCQGFSMANRQRLINEPRNRLYKKFVETVNIIKPKIFLMENVKGMLGVAEQVVEDFEKIGYVVKYKVYNAKNFGIPQNRERLFYIGLRSDGFKAPAQLVEEIFQKVSTRQSKTEIPIKDAFWGLRPLEARTIKNDTGIESPAFGFTKDALWQKHKRPSTYVLRINAGKIPRHIYNHKARYNNARDIKIYKLLPPGGKSDHAAIAHIMPYKNRSHVFKDKFYKLPPDVPSKTITSHMKFDCHMYIHPFEPRGLTPREAARIQSFPDTYAFHGPFTQWYNQIGNAVPPFLANVFAEVLKGYLT